MSGHGALLVVAGAIGFLLAVAFLVHTLTKSDESISRRWTDEQLEAPKPPKRRRLKKKTRAKKKAR